MGGQGIALLALIGIGLWAWSRRTQAAPVSEPPVMPTPAPAPVPTPVPEPAPIPVPSPVTNKTAIAVSVVNAAIQSGLSTEAIVKLAADSLISGGSAAFSGWTLTRWNANRRTYGESIKAGSAWIEWEQPGYWTYVPTLYEELAHAFGDDFAKRITYV